MTSPLRIVPLALLVAVGAAPRPAWGADPRPGAGESATEARARALYEQGIRHYNLNEHDEAIAAFKEGYKLSGSAGFLYNIAQAYRLKGDCAQALSFYRNYLRADPQADNRAAVEARIAAMAECVQATPPSPRAAPLPPAAPVRGGGLRVAGLVVAGIGLAAAGTSVYFGLDARHAADDLSTRYETGGTWDQAAHDTEARGQRSQALMLALSITGGAAIVAGGVLYFLGWRTGREERQQVTVLPTSRGGLLAWSGSF
jgi:tetratricopeptide (TPR) repeat protein